MGSIVEKVNREPQVPTEGQKKVAKSRQGRKGQKGQKGSGVFFGWMGRPY